MNLRSASSLQTLRVYIMFMSHTKHVVSVRLTTIIILLLHIHNKAEWLTALQLRHYGDKKTFYYL